MNKNILVVARSPSLFARWQEAFPAGLRLDSALALSTATAGDILWVAVELEGWQHLVADAVSSNRGCYAVVISNSPETKEALIALEAGARGYCHAYSVPALFGEIAQVVGMGGLWVGPELLSRLIGAVRGRLPDQTDALTDVLTAREAEVAREVADGRSNKEVAAKLGITERTVKAHLGAVFEKLRVRDRLQLVLRLSGRVESGTRE